MSQPVVMTNDSRYRNAAWLIIENKPGPLQQNEPQKPLYIFFNKYEAEKYAQEQNLKRSVSGRYLLKVLPLTINMPYIFTEHKNQLEIF